MEKKTDFTERVGKCFLNNGLKFHTLSKHLGYGKQVFPQENPSAQTYQIFNVCLYTHEQVEPVAKTLWDQTGKST